MIHNVWPSKTRKEIVMKLTYANCMHFEGDDGFSNGVSVTEEFLFENPDVENNPAKGKKEELELELTVIGKEAKWAVNRRVFNVWCAGFPMGDFGSEKKFSSFDEVVEHLTSEEMPAFADFMDYVVECLEEHSEFYPDCKTLLKELIVRKGAKQASADGEQHG